MPSGDEERWFQRASEALERAHHADYSSERRLDIEEAAAAFQEVTLRVPEHAQAWYLLGRCWSDLGHHDRAGDAYATVVSLRPDDLLAWFYRAQALVEAGRHAEAVAACDEVLRLAPDEVAAWYLKMTALALLRRHAEVLVASDNVLRSDGKSRHGFILPWALVQYARFYRAGALEGLGRREEARTAFAEAFSWEGPARAHVYYEVLATSEEARAAYRDRLSRSPEDGTAWTCAGHDFWRAGRARDSLEAYERAIRLRPDDPLAWSGKAEALVLEGRIDESIPAFEEAVRRPGGERIQARLDVVRQQPGPSADARRGDDAKPA
jgi:tetratricopeptide (TPR) repeat protein